MRLIGRPRPCFRFILKECATQASVRAYFAVLLYIVARCKYCYIILSTKYKVPLRDVPAGRAQKLAENAPTISLKKQTAYKYSLKYTVLRY